MPKFYGKVGYAETKETTPGVWEEVITERPYYGDVIKNYKRFKQGSDTTNSDIDISTQISIVADPFAYQHFFNMKYVEWMGVKWIVSNIDVNRPRLILSIGGIYNENES